MSRRRLIRGLPLYFNRCAGTLHVGNFSDVRTSINPFICLRKCHASASLSSERKDYEILELSKDATQDDIKDFHADNSIGAENGSYTSENVNVNTHHPSGQKYGEDPFSSRFYRIFSTVFEQEEGIKADDIEVVVSLSFSEAAKGCSKQFDFRAKICCGSCNGKGHQDNSKQYVCAVCNGVGKVTYFSFTSVCENCKGSGRVIKDYCLTCKGSGVIDGVKNVNVIIPAGVDSGDVIRVAEAGNSGGKGVSPGNLDIKLQVATDPNFIRVGDDIHVEKSISFIQAILGGMVEVPTLDGITHVKIPKGCQPGHSVILRGKGLPRQAARLDYGDQYVQIRVRFPSFVNERQRAILEEFALEEATLDNTPLRRDWPFQQLSTG